MSESQRHIHGTAITREQYAARRAEKPITADERKRLVPIRSKYQSLLPGVHLTLEETDELAWTVAVMRYCESCKALPLPHFEEVPLDTWKADVVERLTEIRAGAVAT